MRATEIQFVPLGQRVCDECKKPKTCTRVSVKLANFLGWNHANLCMDCNEIVGRKLAAAFRSAPQQMDEAADDSTQVELQHELGPKGKFKLYVHKAGVTIFRMCKINAEQIEMPEDAVPFINLR